MSDLKFENGMDEEPGRERQSNYARAQDVVYQHVNRRRGKVSEYSRDVVQVVWCMPPEGGINWEAIVRIVGEDEKMFVVTYTQSRDETKLDTYTRKHVPRFF